MRARALSSPGGGEGAEKRGGRVHVLECERSGVYACMYVRVRTCVAVCYSVLQCAAVCCSVLRCVAVCCSVCVYVCAGAHLCASVFVCKLEL